MTDLTWQVAEEFIPTGRITDLKEYGNGNINDTYLVSVEAGPVEYFILQRINTRVFPRPKWVLSNLRTLARHVDTRLMRTEGTASRRWEIPHILETRAGKDYYRDPQGSFWRAISFIAKSTSYDTILNRRHAWEAGYALGRFQSLVSDLSTDKMYDTLEGFHITPRYLEGYDQILARTLRGAGSSKASFCYQTIAAHRSWASVLEDAKERGELQMRIIHGDPKINNFMISDQTGQAVSVVDLDTVKPGLVHYDIGDCLRSSCNPLGEETTDFEKIRFDLQLARVILEGYLSVAHQFLTGPDYAYIYDAICLIPFELGLRFFTDYLAGNQYFKVRHPDHNLDRALVQFKLLESIEAQENEIRTILAGLQEGVP